MAVNVWKSGKVKKDGGEGGEEWCKVKKDGKGGKGGCRLADAAAMYPKILGGGAGMAAHLSRNNSMGVMPSLSGSAVLAPACKSIRRTEHFNLPEITAIHSPQVNSQNYGDSLLDPARILDLSFVRKVDQEIRNLVRNPKSCHQ